MYTFVLTPRSLSLVLAGASDASRAGLEMGAMIWSKETLNPGTLFCPQVGKLQMEKVHNMQLLDPKDVKWQFGCWDQIDTVQGQEVRLCNWIRFVTVSGDCNTANVICSKLGNGQSLYQVTKPTPRNTEIIVYFPRDSAEDSDGLVLGPSTSPKPLMSLPEYSQQIMDFLSKNKSSFLSSSSSSSDDNKSAKCDSSVCTDESGIAMSSPSRDESEILQITPDGETQVHVKDEVADDKKYQSAGVVVSPPPPPPPPPSSPPPAAAPARSDAELLGKLTDEGLKLATPVTFMDAAQWKSLYGSGFSAFGFSRSASPMDMKPLDLTSREPAPRGASPVVEGNTKDLTLRERARRLMASKTRVASDTQRKLRLRGRAFQQLGSAARQRKEDAKTVKEEEAGDSDQGQWTLSKALQRVQGQPIVEISSSQYPGSSSGGPSVKENSPPTPPLEENEEENEEEEQNAGDGSETAEQANSDQEALDMTTAAPKATTTVRHRPRPKFAAKPRAVGPRTPRKKRVHTCRVCGKKFDRPSLLERHIRTHTGERPYKCDFCGKRFSTTSSLNTHRRTHTGEKPHICPMCSKCFTASSNLYYHKITHFKVKPHKCRVCPKSFPTPGDLRSHMYLHSGEWPFKCTVCDKGFSKPTNLANHMATHSGVKPYKCTQCDKQFASIANLKSHMKTHEPKEEQAAPRRRNMNKKQPPQQEEQDQMEEQQEQEQQHEQQQQQQQQQEQQQHQQLHQQKRLQRQQQHRLLHDQMQQQETERQLQLRQQYLQKLEKKYPHLMGMTASSSSSSPALSSTCRHCGVPFTGQEHQRAVDGSCLRCYTYLAVPPHHRPTHGSFSLNLTAPPPSSLSRPTPPTQPQQQQQPEASSGHSERRRISSRKLTDFSIDALTGRSSGGGAGGSDRGQITPNTNVNIGSSPVPVPVPVPGGLVSPPVTPILNNPFTTSPTTITTSLAHYPHPRHPHQHSYAPAGYSPPRGQYYSASASASVPHPSLLSPSQFLASNPLSSSPFASSYHLSIAQSIMSSLSTPTTPPQQMSTTPSHHISTPYFASGIVGTSTPLSGSGQVAAASSNGVPFQAQLALLLPGSHLQSSPYDLSPQGNSGSKPGGVWNPYMSGGKH